MRSKKAKALRRIAREAATRAGKKPEQPDTVVVQSGTASIIHKRDKDGKVMHGEDGKPIELMSSEPRRIAGVTKLYRHLKKEMK